MGFSITRSNSAAQSGRGDFRHPAMTSFVATKLGSKLATPAWMSGTAQIYFPRFVDIRRYRRFLSNLPAALGGVVFSTDHSSGTGRIGLATFSSPEGTWTDTGAEIYSQANQFETPHVYFDIINQNRMLMMGHRDTSAGHTYSDQHSRALSTTTLAAGGFTDLGSAFAFGNHTGYASVEPDYRNQQFKAWGHLNGDTLAVAHYSTSSNGETFTLQRKLFRREPHVVGEAFGLWGVTRIFKFSDGKHYRIVAKFDGPGTSGPAAGAAHSIGVIPVDPITYRATGGYIELITPSAGLSDTDYRLLATFDIINWNGTWYIVYLGRDNNNNQYLNLARLGRGTSTQFTPLVSLNTDGSIVTPSATVTTVIDWDAANADPPAGITVTVASGSNASSRSAGNYYEFKSGSGSQQNLRMAVNTNIDPTAHEVVELTIENLKFDTDSDSSHDTFQSILFIDDIANIDGVWLALSQLTTSFQYRKFINNVGTNIENTYCYPLMANTSNVRDWARTIGTTVTVRIQDAGETLVILHDGMVGYYRTNLMATDGITWGTGNCQFILRLFTNTPHPAQYMRFGRITVKTYD